MELELPRGPWKKLLSGNWMDSPAMLYENPDKMLLIVASQKIGGVVSGFLCRMAKPYVVDQKKPLELEKTTFDYTAINKHAGETDSNFLLVLSQHKYAEYSKSQLLETVNKLFDEVEKSDVELHKTKANLVELVHAPDAMKHELYSDPLLFFWMLSPKANLPQKPIIRVYLGLDKEGQGSYVKLDSFSHAFVVGNDPSKRLHAVHILAEDALENNVPVIGFDATGAFLGIGHSNKTNVSSAFSEFKMVGSPVGFPFKQFTVGTNVFIDLTKITSEDLLNAFSISPEEPAAKLIAKALASGKVHDFGDLTRALEAIDADQDEKRQALRLVSTLLKYSGSTIGSFASSELSEPWKQGIGKFYHVDLSATPKELYPLAAKAVITSLGAPLLPVTTLLVFDQSTEFLSANLAGIIDAASGKSACLVLHSKLGDADKIGFEPTLNIEFVDNEAVVSENGETPVRIRVRPSFSQCTESMPSTSQTVAGAQPSKPFAFAKP